jgi:tetratricopeptide (TPR) repeat protein
MKIVMQGQFLREGLLELGHEVVSLQLQQHLDITEQIQSVCPDPDLIVLELHGSIAVPDNFYECRYPTVAYCIDSPLNEFYLNSYLHLFDFVFVDQKSSVANLKKYGITAKLLPLCVSKTMFREQRDKLYDISFVGTLSEHRKKRINLLNFLQQYYHINYISGVPVELMQNIFAQSKIVLNENLFPGLTLRIFQGLASGSLLLTESDGGGVTDFFEDGTHLVCYNPGNILEIIYDILHDYEKYQCIARTGQQECLARHTSKNRAEKLLEGLHSRPIAKAKRTSEAKFYLANTQYNMSLRYGGNFTHAVRLFKEILPGKEIESAWAAYFLGNIYIRLAKEEKAIEMYTFSISKGLALYPLIKLCLLFVKKGDNDSALRMIEKILLASPYIKKFLHSDLLQIDMNNTSTIQILLFISKIYYILGNIFNVGFLKQCNDIYPDTALEVAILAWNEEPSRIILDFMLHCAKQYNIEGEMLPFIFQAVRGGFASEEQILEACRISESYYDFALKKQLTEIAGLARQSPVTLSSSA